MFIVFEGLDGSGASTQVSLLAKGLETIGKSVIETKEPTTMHIGQLVRDYLKNRYSADNRTLQLLFAADRSNHIEKLIKPSLNENKIVVCDRYFYSSIAFGSLSVDINWLENIYDIFLKPDIVFLIKLSPEECIKRIEKRGNDKELFEKKETLEKVWITYEYLASKYKNLFYVLDGMKSIENIGEDVMDVVRERI